MTTDIGKTLDDTDRRLLALLREDGRASTADLGRRLQLSRTTVQSRMDRLRQRGVIAGFTVRESEAHARGQIQAHVQVTALPKSLPGIEAALRRMPEVRKLYAISGSYDFIAVVVAESVGAMDVLLDRIGALDGVDRTLSSIILSTRIDR